MCSRNWEDLLCLLRFSTNESYNSERYLWDQTNELFFEFLMRSLSRMIKAVVSVKVTGGGRFCLKSHDTTSSGIWYKRKLHSEEAISRNSVSHLTARCGLRVNSNPHSTSGRLEMNGTSVSKIQHFSVGSNGDRSSWKSVTNSEKRDWKITTH